MLAEIIHPETGEKHIVDIPNLRTEDLEGMSRQYTTNEKIKAQIERIPVSAEVKVIIYKLVNFTIQVGETVVRVGKKIMEIALMFAAKYKSATLGLILAGLLYLLVASIPLLGPVLASMLAPLMLLLGLGAGMWEDLKRDTPKLAISIEEAAAIFSPLKTAKA